MAYKKNGAIKMGIGFFIVALVMMTSVQSNNFNITKTIVNNSENKSWTTLFYIDNDYLNSGDLLESIFIDEISSNQNLNVFVIQDKLDGPAFYYFIDENHDKILLEELGEVNMADSQTLRDFINYGKDHYPADRYLL